MTPAGLVAHSSEILLIAVVGGSQTSHMGLGSKLYFISLTRPGDCDAVLKLGVKPRMWAT